MELQKQAAPATAAFDPMQFDKKKDLSRKRIRPMTIFLLLLLGTAFWIFLASIGLVPNPFLVTGIKTSVTLTPTKNTPAVQGVATSVLETFFRD